jgi:hypothetical protein
VILTYSSIERIIARFLTRIPGIKKIVKLVYQYINWLIYKKEYKINSMYELEQLGKELNSESFFGYYDKSPQNTKNTHLIYHSISYPTTKKQNPAIPIEIILQDKSTRDLLLRIPSVAYNWQQGCRLQWLNDDLFIFNDFDTLRRKYISRVWSACSLKEEKTFDYPVQDAYKTEFFLSLNYRRLMALRPDYGYCNLPLLTKEELKETENDGIWKVEYATKKSTLLINLDSIRGYECNQQVKYAIHKVNHLMISPSGKQFIFLHRYYINTRRFHRLLLADSRTGNLKVLADYGIISHCCWVNEKTILGYMCGPAKKYAYWLIDIEAGNFMHIANGKLDHYGDGHPHVYGEWFITDTYPDKSRMQRLILANWKTGEYRELGKFLHSFKYSGETRCDLHPRFSLDGKSIFFDSVFTNKRYLYKIDVPL